MNNGVHRDSVSENSLVRLYVEITGVPESAARSVFMYVCGDNGKATNGDRLETGILAERVLAGGQVSDRLPKSPLRAYHQLTVVPAVSGV